MQAAKAILPGLVALMLGAGPAMAGGPAAAAREKTIEAWGWEAAREQELARSEIGAAELRDFLQGAASNLAGQAAPVDPLKVAGDVERLAATRREKVRREIAARNEAAARVAFAERAKRPGVQPLAHGALYEIVQPGTGEPPKPGQTLTLHYTGHLLDGTEFIQLGPYEVVLVPNRLEPALFAAVQKIGRGGIVRVYVPPPLAAGDDVRLGIEPGSARVYDLELIGTRVTTPQELADSLLPPAPEPPPPVPSGLPEETIWRSWGWTVGQKSGAAAFHLSEAERAAWVRGLAEGIRDEPDQRALRQLAPQVVQFVADERRKVRLATQHRRQEERRKLFAELKTNPRVVEQPDGLRYEIVEPGTGAHAKTGDVVIVEYTGRLGDGTVFDRTDNEPLHIQIGLVNAGLNEGLQLIGRGGHIKLYVPPELGYGSENASGVIGPIPADSTLLYDLRLLGIEPGEAKR